MKTDRELADIIARAFKKNGTDDEVIEDNSQIYLGEAELTILFQNEVIVAFRTWTYDGTWFAVVDLAKEELIMSSTDSSTFNESDRLILYQHPDDMHINCFFCSKPATIRQAMKDEWIPYFYGKDNHEHNYVCGACSMNRLTLAADGEWFEV